MKALASMAVNSKSGSIREQHVEVKSAWKNSPLILVKSRPEKGKSKASSVEESHHFVLGYN